MRAISATKMRNISAVEVPSDLVTALALASNGFSTRQRKSTVMSQLCHAVHFRQPAFRFHAGDRPKLDEHRFLQQIYFWQS